MAVQDVYGGGPQSNIPGGNEEPKKKKKRPPQPTPPPPQQPHEPQQNPGPTGGSQPTNPQSPPYNPPSPPVNTPNYEQQYEKSFRTFVQNQRTSSFSPTTIQQAPFLVADLVFSGASNRHISKIASGLDSAMAWLTQPMTAETLQALIRTRIAPYDPNVLAQLPLGDFHSTAAVMGTQQGEANAAVRDVLSRMQAALIQQRQQDLMRAVEQMADQTSAQAAQKELDALTESWGPDYGAPLDSALNWVNNRLYDLGSALSGGDPARERLENPDIQKNPAGYAFNAEVNAITKPFTAPFEVGAKALGIGGEALDTKIPGTNIAPFGFVRDVTDFALKGPSALFRWVGEASLEAGAKVSEALGIDPRSPMGEGITNLTAFLLQWEGGKVFGHSAAAYREARLQPKEITAPKITGSDLKAAAKAAGLRGVKTPSAAFNARLSNTMLGVRGPISGIHEVLARSIYELASRPAETWFTGRGIFGRKNVGRRFADDVIRSNRRSAPGQAAGALQEMMPEMAPSLARDLAKMDTWQDVASYMIERVRKPGADAVTAKKLRLENLQNRLAKGGSSAPPLESGMVRLFRGEGEGSVQGGHYFADTPSSARRNGEAMTWVDVPKDVADAAAQAARADGSVGYLLPDEYARQAKPHMEGLTDLERANLIFDIAETRKWLENLKPDQPIFRVPRRMILTQLMTGSGGRIVRLLNHLVAPTRMPGIFTVSRAFDDAPKSSHIEFPSGERAGDIAAQNTKIVSSILHRLGVKKARVQAILTKMAESKTEFDYFRVFTHDIAKAIEDTPRIRRDMVYALTERWKTEASERHKSRLPVTEEQARQAFESGYQAEGRDMLTTKDTYDQRHPSPTQSSQLVHSIPFIDFELAIEATSYARQLTRYLRRTASGGDAALQREIKAAKKGATADDKATLRMAHKEARGQQRYTPKALLARAPLVPLDLIQGILDASTALFKPLTLVTRSLAALPLRIQLEQGARNFFWGYDPVVVGKGKAFKEATSDPQIMEALGAVVRESMEPVNTRTAFFEQDFHDQRLPVDKGRTEMSPKQLDALAYQFEAARQSPEIRELIKLGPDEFLRQATGQKVGPAQDITPFNFNYVEPEAFLMSRAMSTLENKMPGGEGYVYHVGSADSLPGVQQRGLLPSRPPEGAWEDGSTGERLYFAYGAEDFGGEAIPRRGRSIVYRVRNEAIPSLVEGADEFHTEGVVPPSAVEVLAEDGRWRSLTATTPGGTPETATLHRFKQTFQPIFDRSNELGGMTWAEQVRQWADWKYEEMKQLSGGRDDLLRSILSGRFDDRGGLYRDAVRAGEGRVTLLEDYDRLLDERATLKAHIRDSEGSVQQGYKDAMKEVRDEIKALERQGAATERNLWSVSYDHPESFKAALAENHMRGDYTPPAKAVGPDQVSIRGSDRGRISASMEASRALSKWLYTGMKFASFADIKGTRGSLFYQIFRDRFSELAARYGTKDVEWLKSQAMWRAARETAALHYDLNARSSLHRATRNIFWFLPAYQEVLTTWLVKMPARYGPPPIGLLYEANQINAVVNLVNNMGWTSKGPPTQDNPEGESRIVLPDAVTRFFDKIVGGLPTEGPNKTIISFSPKSLNLVAGGLPTVSPVVAIPLGTMARKEGGIYKTLSDLFTFNGADTAIMPQGLNYLYEGITGEQAPWELFSKNLLANIHDSAFDDALAMAYYNLSREGVKPPDPQDFSSQDAYGKARENYYKRWMAEAESIHKGRYLVKAFGATMSPAALHVTSQYREDFMRTWWKITGGKELTDGLTPEMSAQLETWISTHPGGLAYRVFRNKKGDPVKPLAYEATDLNDLYYTGELGAISPEVFMRRVAITESNRYFTLQRQALYKGLSTDEVLLSYNKIHNQLDAINQAQDEWRTLNPQEYGEYQAYIQGFPDDTESKSLQQELQDQRLSKTISGLKDVAKLLTNEGGYRDPDLRATLGKLQGLYADTNPDYGPPRTPVEKGIGWFIDNVFSPYMDETLPLYDKARQLSEAGARDEASAIYDQIRELKNSWRAKILTGLIKAPDGMGFSSPDAVPNPEEYLFAHLTDVEKQRRVLHWITEPIGWLSDFERENAGFGADPKIGTMFTAIDDFLNGPKVKGYIEANDISPGSKWMDLMDEYADGEIKKYTDGLGSKFTRLYALSIAPPYQRLVASGYGAGDEQWQRIVDWAKNVTEQITTPWPDTNPDIHYSPEGDTSDVQKYWKERFFNSIDNLRLKNPDGPLDDLFTDLEYAMAGHGDSTRSGYSLYDALFFNQWQTRLVPDRPNIYLRFGAAGEERDAQLASHPYMDFHPMQWAATFQPTRVPYSAMIKLKDGSYPNTNNGLYYRPDLAMGLLAAREEFKNQTGEDLFSYIVSGYRNFQSADPRATEISNSDHSLAGAVDFTSNSRADLWMREHGWQYGFGAPDDHHAGQGYTWRDAGHFSFVAGGFYGSHSAADNRGVSWGVPDMSLDKRWILAARNYAPDNYQAPITTTSSGSNLTAPQGVTDRTANRDYARQVAEKQYGWGPEDFKYIRYIVEGHNGVPPESNWDGSAVNKKGGAAGIGQRYPKAWPWESDAEREKYMSDIQVQIAWFYDYIRSRYGTPKKAWEYKEANGGY